jgi:RNA polymerase sigma-70 factor (ECF subfamily)
VPSLGSSGHRVIRVIGSSRSYDPPVDAVDAARGGDVAAFNSLVEAHQRQVYNLCLRTLGNAEDAADATQEAFFRAYRAIATFRAPPDRFRAWLLRIAVNACYDALRRHKRQPTQSLDALAEPPDTATTEPTPVPDPAPGPEQQTLTAETRRALEQSIAKLSPDHRLTVVLCDVQGLSYDDAAQAMGVEIGTVKSRLSRARAILRDALVARGELARLRRRQD